MLIGILIAFVIFSVIILVHEFGHFITAKFFGVKVYEFGLGLPPRALKLWTDKNGTIYSINWLPLGGFVKLKGENAFYFPFYDEKGKKIKQDEIKEYLEKDKKIFDKKGKEISKKDKDEYLKLILENEGEDSLQNISFIKKSIIVLAGVTMNFLLAIVILTVMFTVGLKPAGINTVIETDLNVKIIPTFEQAYNDGIILMGSGTRVQPLTGSLAEKSGLKENDLVLKVNNESIGETQDLMTIINDNAGNTLNFEILRDEKDILNLDVKIGDDGKIGAYLRGNYEFNQEFKYKYSFPKSLIEAIKETYNEAGLTIKSLGVFLKNIIFPEKEGDRKEALDSVSGPVGIVSIVSEAAKNGIEILLIFTCLITVNLGVFNLLPIPALDGGRFLFFSINGIINKLTGKKGISPYIEGIIHVIFFVFLILLSIVVMYNDILKIFNN